MSKLVRDHLRSNVVGYVAVFLALSMGTAYATHPGGANTISSGDIINGEVRGDDLGANSVGSNKIADRSVKNADLSIGASSSNTIADGGVQGIDVKNNTLTGAQVDEPTLFNDDSLTDEDLAPSAQFNGAAPTGGDLTGTYPNPTIGNGKVTPEKIGTIPAARVIHVVHQDGGCFLGHLVPNATPTDLMFVTEQFDTADLHTSACAPNLSRLTAPRAGLYQVSAGVIWMASATGKRSLFLSMNDTDLVAQNEYDAAGDGATIQNVSTLVKLAEGDYVEAGVNQTSGGSLGVGFDLDPRNHFAMTWVGPG